MSQYKDITYPRVHNGLTDNGKAISKRKCPNCGSPDFKETVSREFCPSCKLECDYWGKGSNRVYTSMMKERWREEEIERMYLSAEDDEW